MSRILISWIGHADLRAPAEDPVVGNGPVAQALGVREFDAVELLSDYAENVSAPFLEWLRPWTTGRCHGPATSRFQGRQNSAISTRPPFGLCPGRWRVMGRMRN